MSVRKPLTQVPELASQFHSSRNSPLTPDTVGIGFKESVWWVCPRGHEWQASPANRKNKGTYSCPICNNRIIVPGVNDVATTHPYLKSEVHLSNQNILETLSFGSSKIIEWVCSEGHTWKASISSRTTKGSGCPFCAGQRVLPGVNDLMTQRPDLATQFDIHKNHPLTPGEIAINSHRKVWWLCKFQHSWPSTVSNRSLGRGCPVCSGRQPLKGFNDLVTTHPSLADQLHPSNSFQAESLTHGSSARVDWQCAQGHVWSAPVYSRAGGSGCPRCAPDSVPETLLRNLLQGAKARVSLKGKPSSKEVDIFLEPNVVVEYDGSYWHRESTDRDRRMSKLLIDSGYLLVRVREQPLKLLPHMDGMAQVRYSREHESMERLSSDVLHLIELLKES